jgi:hypothetical protein
MRGSKRERFTVYFSPRLEFSVGRVGKVVLTAAAIAMAVTLGVVAIWQAPYYGIGLDQSPSAARWTMGLGLAAGLSVLWWRGSLRR